MAKSKVSEKITTTHQLSIECTLDVDKLTDGIIIGEVEDEGEKDLAELIKKFNGEYVKIVITNKIEEEPKKE